MSGYYIPEIEEFNIKFEYEIFGTKGWYDSKILPLVLNYGHIKMLIEREQVRVKYLDDEDIESLGWIKSDYKSFNNDVFYFKEYQLIFKNHTSVKIIKDDMDVVYFGEIKNKNFFKKILEAVIV
tara:strand:+ start:135 stop:506 length:372 start_codon:yes stop_codon:yes gene_type:complete